MCSAVLWLLCKILFNNTATEEVLYYLSHCSSLQPQHCISTLLFFTFTSSQQFQRNSCFSYKTQQTPAVSLPHPAGASPASAAAEGLCQLPWEGPDALPGSVHPWQAWPQPCAAHSCQDKRGRLFPHTKIRIMGAAAGLQLLFIISEIPIGKRSCVPWGHGWSSPLRRCRGNLDPLNWHYRCSEATCLPSHSIAALARSYPKQSDDPWYLFLFLLNFSWFRRES